MALPSKVSDAKKAATAAVAGKKKASGSLKNESEQTRRTMARPILMPGIGIASVEEPVLVLVWGIP